MSNPGPPHLSRPAPEEPTETTSSQPPPPQQQQQPSLTQIYLGLSSYPFAQDPEYQSGLATILGHPETAATPEEIEQEVDLVLQAQCFYFARKYNVPPVDPAAYAAWLKEREQETQGGVGGAGGGSEDAGQSTLPPPPPLPPLAATGPADPPPQTQPAPQTQAPLDDQQPPYPTSFAAIVDLITRNIPVPGIEEIPTTVLEPGSSKVDKTPRRRKPWEKETDHDELSTEDVSKKDATDVTSGVDVVGGTSPDAAIIDINGHRETGTGVVNILKPNAVPDSGLLSKE